MEQKIVLDINQMSQEQNIKFFEDMGSAFDDERGNFDGEHFEIMLEGGIVWGEYMVIAGYNDYNEGEDDWNDYPWI